MKKGKEPGAKNETKTSPGSKTVEAAKNLTYNESNPQDRPFTKQTQQQKQTKEYQDLDILLLGKTVIVKLFDGVQVKAMMMSMGKYWVALRVLDDKKPRTLIVNKAHVVYYEIINNE
jgi:hypothetical protein|nr:MAG: hypothetical protein TU35_06855 [Thermoproteus sp. AZ2]